MQQIVAGIDGGATQTRVALADPAGKILGMGTSGPSNYGSVSEDKILGHIEEAFRQAFGLAEISITKGAAIFLGIAGVVSAADREAIRRIVERSDIINAKKIKVDHDIRISLAGGLGGQEGIALIVGTGSSCYGRTSSGCDWMAGGWGHLLDDRGSAYDLARCGLVSVVRAADGRGPETNLTEAFMHKLNVSRTAQIMHRIYVEGPSGQPMDKTEIASLAAVVTKVADAGDEIALQIVREGMHELVMMVRAVARQLNFSSSSVSLVISGGTVNGSPLIKDELYKALKSSMPEITIKEPTLSPVKGGLLLALQQIGVDIDERIVTNIEETIYSEV